MATSNVGILTNAGKNLIDQVNAGQTKITFSKIAFSSMDNSQLTDDQVKALTAITPQEIVVNNPEVTLDNNTGETRIRATGTNEALKDGVYVKTYAVYAKDGSGNESLYGITVSPNPNYLPEYDGVTPQAVTYSYKVNISNTSEITFTNSNDIYVSETDLAEAVQPYAKTVDVNQQLDKKVTDNKDNTITVNGINYDLSNSSLKKLTYVGSGSFNDLPIGTVFANAFLMADGPDTAHGYITTTFSSNMWNGRKAQIAIADAVNSMYFRIYASSWSAWSSLADDYKVVHTADMRKSPSDVAGIEEVNAKQDKLTYTPADDSKVAHLSGANNFDTVPTVNNNSLLLASSLPSDLARTGQDANFTGKLQKSGKDVATTDDITNSVNLKQDKLTYTPADDSKVVHTTGDETIDGQKKFKIDPTDTAGNAYAKTVDVNQQLDKKVNTSDTTNWQQQALFSKGGYCLDSTSLSKMNFFDLLTNKYNTPGVRIIRDDNYNSDPKFVGIINAFVICEGDGWWYAYGVDWHSNFWYRKIAETTDTGWIMNADDNKVVHTADMRKPASDVAGIEEVNAKQDAIGYTPADDSKVVHSTDASNWQKQAMFNPGDFKIDITSSTTDFATLLRTNYDKGGIVYIRDDFEWPVTNAVVICEGTGWWYAYGVNSDGNFVHRRIRATDDTGWIMNADDNEVAHLSGANNFDTVPTVNNNPLLLANSLPSDLALTSQSNTFNLLQTFSQGIKTLQTGSYDDANSLVNEGIYFNTNLSIKNGAGTITAGFIQVISGMWDRIRQIIYSDLNGTLIYTRVSSDGGSTWGNWVQILTADQLPSDLARTGQDTNFTGKLQKSGKDVAIDSQVVHRNPDTGAVSDSVNFTAGLQSGGVSVATSDDLKSVVNSSWRQLDPKFLYYFRYSVKYNFDSATVLYKINDANKYIEIILSSNVNSENGYSFNVTLDLSSIVTSVKSSNAMMACDTYNNNDSMSNAANLNDAEFGEGILQWDVEWSQDQYTYTKFDLVDKTEPIPRIYYNGLKPGVI